MLLQVEVHPLGLPAEIRCGIHDHPHIKAFSLFLFQYLSNMQTRFVAGKDQCLYPNGFLGPFQQLHTNCKRFVAVFQHSDLA
jgi:hypothetical protein